MEVFPSADVLQLFQGKKVVFLGNSSARGCYKDLLCLIKGLEVGSKVLKAKMEESVYGDRLLRCGKKFNGSEYVEERMMHTSEYQFSYYFLSRVYSIYVKRVLDEIFKENPPDLLVIDCWFAEISRSWSFDTYKSNLISLLKLLRRLVPSHCLVVWFIAPSVSSTILSTYNVNEANKRKEAREIIVAYGYNVLDVYQYLRILSENRSDDWITEATRFVTNLLLTHISLKWDKNILLKEPRMIKIEEIPKDQFVTVRVDDLDRCSSPELMLLESSFENLRFQWRSREIIWTKDTRAYPSKTKKPNQPNWQKRLLLLHDDVFTNGALDEAIVAYEKAKNLLEMLWCHEMRHNKVVWTGDDRAYANEDPPYRPNWAKRRKLMKDDIVRGMLDATENKKSKNGKKIIRFSCRRFRTFTRLR